MINAFCLSYLTVRRLENKVSYTTCHEKFSAGNYNKGGVPNKIIREIQNRCGGANGLKLNFAGHVATMPHEKCTKIIMEWRPREQALRNRGRLPTRWIDDVKRISTNWIQAAQDRKKWG